MTVFTNILPKEIRKVIGVEYYHLFPRSVKRGILEWLMNAKQAETRLKRITEIVSKAERNERANQFVKK